MLEINNTDVTPEKLKLNDIVPCRRCGWCCKDSIHRLLLEDIEIMCKCLNMNIQKFTEKYVNKKWLEEKKEYTLKTPCPFLIEYKNINSCQIYPKKCKSLICQMRLSPMHLSPMHLSAKANSFSKADSFSKVDSCL